LRTVELPVFAAARSGRLRLRLGLRGRPLALDVGQPAFPFLNFIVLSAHNKNLYTTDALRFCMTMKIRSARFNIYLVAVLAALAVAGCAGTKHKNKKNDIATLISLHLEVSSDETQVSAPVPILRAQPEMVNVETEAFLDEGALESARVVDDLGGFHIRLKFNWEGTMVLDGITTDNQSRRIAVLAKWDKDTRWLAAPVIHRRVSDGTFDFTPDATREEADRIVQGLTNLVAKVKDADKF
jgi:hypothetical protein